MPIEYGSTSYLTTLIWTGDMFASGNAATVLGWNGPAESNSAGDVLAGFVGTSWDTYLREFTDSDITLARIDWETMTYSGSVAIGLAGGLSVTGLPSSNALLTLKKGALKGRRNAGRNFWPGMLPEASVDERGIVTPAQVTARQSAFNEFVLGLVTSTPSWEPSIPQSVTDTSVTPPIIPWPATGDWVVANIIGTQRRRVRP